MPYPLIPETHLAAHLPNPGAPLTCGWYVWAGEDFPTADDAFSPVHVAHVLDRCPGLVPFLGLAPGWPVLLAPGHVDVWYDGTLLDVRYPAAAS